MTENLLKPKLVLALNIAEFFGNIKGSSEIVPPPVDDKNKAFVMLDITYSQNGNMPAGQTKTAIINESGLYSFIHSRKTNEKN